MQWLVRTIYKDGTSRYWGPFATANDAAEFAVKTFDAEVEWSVCPLRK